MTIILAGSYPPGTLEKFKTYLPNAEFIEVHDQNDYDTLDRGDLIVVRVLKTTKETIQSKKSLKGIIRWGAGYDSVDIEAAGTAGIFVAVTPGANAYAVSELAVGLMVAIGRKLTFQSEMTRNGSWDQSLKSSEMTTLNKKTVGILGIGNIGKGVAKIVQTFGASVVYYDALRLEESLEKQLEIKYVSFLELIRTSDVISVHIPLMENTYHIISDAEFEEMKNDVIIINTARGGVIDEMALAKAIQSGKVLGAGLDCVENENMTTNPLNKLDNVIITPHIGGTSNDIAYEMIPRIGNQLLKFSETGTVDYIVNKAFLG